MSAPSRQLVELLGEICREEGIQLSALSQDWVLRLERQGRIGHVYGYHFGINSAAAELIAGDKLATFAILQTQGVAVIPHRLLERPAQASGLRPLLAAHFAALDGHLVCKLNTGSGGQQVWRLRSLPDFERLAAGLLQEHRCLCLTPYLEIQEEYRVILLPPERLIYRKLRPFVLGDGRTPLGQLAGSRTLPPERSARDVPACGERVLLEWRHNLALGARAEIVTDPATCARLEALAGQALSALNLRLAAVDIVVTDQPDAVLEVNSGLMLEYFARQGPHERRRAKAIYRQAVLTMLAETDQPART